MCIVNFKKKKKCNLLSSQPWPLFVVLLNCRYVLFPQTSIFQSTKQHKKRVNGRISCSALAEKIWPIFHEPNPHTPLFCSSQKCMSLVNVAPFIERDRLFKKHGSIDRLLFPSLQSTYFFLLITNLYGQSHSPINISFTHCHSSGPLDCLLLIVPQRHHHTKPQGLLT